jgi:hypothetical protein
VGSVVKDQFDSCDAALQRRYPEIAVAYIRLFVSRLQRQAADLGQFSHESAGEEKAVSLLKDFISRASGKNATGVLAFFAAPIPAEVVEFVQKATFTEDPVAKYESIMPGVNRSFDLFEMNEADMVANSQDSTDESDYRTVFQLIHPDLKKKAAPSELPATAKRPKKKKKKTEEPTEEQLETAEVIEAADTADSEVSAEA